MSESRARYGWESDFPDFQTAKPSVIRERLAAFVRDASPEQLRAWADSIPPLQHEVGEVLLTSRVARDYSAILEYELPMESRRPDVILLVGAGILVVELKGEAKANQAALDQVSAYARDLRCYHRECADRPVVPVLVPTRARGYVGLQGGVHIAGPDALDTLVADLSKGAIAPPPSRDAFLSEDAYRPLPTLVEAARELFTSGTLRTIHRARAATDPAVEEITRIIHQAALTRSRHLVLVTGVPGAGKTLVGLRTVHARYLDDLASPRDGAKPTVPAVFLSGNGPLVDVLQYELRAAGGDGKTFVRGVKDYVKRYSRRDSLVPPEHVLVFDEAQRAFDADKMREQHDDKHAKSEPEQFVAFADRIPDWCVIVGLIGTGQEIHVGEEGGIGQWYDAINASSRGDWTVHAPGSLIGAFRAMKPEPEEKVVLNLDTELRFHAAKDLHGFVAGLLEGQPSDDLRARCATLEVAGFHFRLTRDLDVAKEYLRDRYASDADARFGLLASSKDRDLERFGIPNDFQSTKRVRPGPWYGDAEDATDGRSCRRLDSCMTEFGAQGLELDAALLAWGTDLIRTDGTWSNANARGYKKSAKIKDARQLRINAYRVLLTRARDVVCLFVPPLPELDETAAYFAASGMLSL
jgi:hypothetical protein